jgi:hypothetical protein
LLEDLNHRGTEDTEKTNAICSNFFLPVFSVFSVPLWFNFFFDAALPRSASVAQLFTRLSSKAPGISDSPQLPTAESR